MWNTKLIDLNWKDIYPLQEREVLYTDKMKSIKKGKGDMAVIAWRFCFCISLANVKGGSARTVETGTVTKLIHTSLRKNNIP